jgi:hypothetical protein
MATSSNLGSQFVLPMQSRYVQFVVEAPRDPKILMITCRTMYPINAGVLYVIHPSPVNRVLMDQDEKKVSFLEVVEDHDGGCRRKKREGEKNRSAR